MLNFLKNFAKGVLYLLVLPFLIVGLAIYAVVAIFIFIYLAIKGLVLFFTGRSLYEDLPEDKEAKRRIAIQNGEIMPEEPKQEVPNTPIQEEIKPQDEINNDPFYVPEYMKHEVQVEKEDDDSYVKVFVPKCRSIVASSSGKLLRRRIKSDLKFKTDLMGRFFFYQEISGRSYFFVSSSSSSCSISAFKSSRFLIHS